MTVALYLHENSLNFGFEPAGENINGFPKNPSGAFFETRAMRGGGWPKRTPLPYLLRFVYSEVYPG